MEDQKKEEASQAGPIQPHATVAFPEDKINGAGFSQYDPATGWVWIGIKPAAFNRKTAWSFIRCQENLIDQIFDKVEQDRMRAMQIANAGKGRGVPMPDFVRKILKH